MKCSRPTCPNLAAAQGRNRGLCSKHYQALPDRGYADAAPVRERILKLNSEGMSYRRIAAAVGMSEYGIYLIRDVNERVQVGTAVKLLGLLSGDGSGLVDPLGTRRRVEALQALGWTRRSQEEQLGWCRSRLTGLCRARKIRAGNAQAVAGLYEVLSGTPGPSEWARAYAAEKGYWPPLAWDDIDNPNEVPALPEDHWMPFTERLAELEYLNIRRSEMPEWLGIQKDSFERQLSRHQLKEAV